MFSGQEPVAKISEDVNSSALPVFKSAHDTKSCQKNIKKTVRKRKKRNGRAAAAAVAVHRERSYMNGALMVFFLFLFKLTFALRTKTSYRPQEGGQERWKPRPPPRTTVHGGRLGRQAFNTITTHAIVACSEALLQLTSQATPPSPPGLSLPFFLCVSMHPCHLQS